VRRYAFATAPRWLAVHLVVLAAFVTMVLLGRWQLDVSNTKHFSLQNFAYALQWWAFALFALLMWARVLRDTAGPSAGRAEVDATRPHPEVETVVTYRRYVPVRPTEDLDPHRGAYNQYLADLAAQDSVTPSPLTPSPVMPSPVTPPESRE
jgi:DNA-binding transcriptional regulator of glucitol operon